MDADGVGRDGRRHPSVRRSLLGELGLLLPGFEEIRERTPRLAPLVLIFVFSVVSAFSVQPFLSAASPGAAGRGLGGVVWLAALFSPLLLGLRAVALTAVSWSVLTVGGRVVRFRPILSVFLYGEAILALRGVILVLVLQLRGPNAVRAVADLDVPMGPAWLVPPDAPVLLATARGATVFHLAWFVFLGLALQRVVGFGRRTAWMVAAGGWILTLVVGALRAMAMGRG